MLAIFPNLAGLDNLGKKYVCRNHRNGFAPWSQLSGQQGAGEISKGLLKIPMLKLITELVNLITAQHAYEINSRAIKASDEMLSTINNLT